MKWGEIIVLTFRVSSRLNKIMYENIQYGIKSLQHSLNVNADLFITVFCHILMTESKHTSLCVLKLLDCGIGRRRKAHSNTVISEISKRVVSPCFEFHTLLWHCLEVSLYQKSGDPTISYYGNHSKWHFLVVLKMNGDEWKLFAKIALQKCHFLSSVPVPVGVYNKVCGSSFQRWCN